MSMDRGNCNEYFAGSGDRLAGADELNNRLSGYRREEDANRQGGAESIHRADGDNASVQRQQPNLQPLASGRVIVGVHQDEEDESLSGAVGGTRHVELLQHEPSYHLCYTSEDVNVQALKCLDKLRRELDDADPMHGTNGDNASVQRPQLNLQLRASGRVNVGVHQGEGDESLSGAVGGTRHVELPQHEASYLLCFQSQVVNIRAFKCLEKLMRELGKPDDKVKTAKVLVQTKKTIRVNFVVMRGVTSNQSITLLLDVATPLWELKETLEAYIGIPARFQAWFQSDHELWNMDTLDGRSIQEDSVIQIDNTDIQIDNTDVTN